MKNQKLKQGRFRSRIPFARFFLLSLLFCFPGGLVRTASAQPKEATKEAEASSGFRIEIGSRELVRASDSTCMDSTLATLRHDENSFYFYHSEDWGETNTKHIGDAADPFKTLVWRKSRDEMFDLNGWYKDIHHPGIWLHNIFKTDKGDLIGVAHVELHHKAPGVNQGENYALGLVHSDDGGNRWTYCGEIVRPHNSRHNIGGTPMLVVGDWFHVYFNDMGPVPNYEDPNGRRLAVARAPIADVVAAARKHQATPWKKYRDGAWDEDGLTGYGSAILPNNPLPGPKSHPADLHADAAYSRTARLYMITRWYYSEGVGRLYLHTSKDGVNFDGRYLLDEEPGKWMPYSTFITDPGDRETEDILTVGSEFYILINHKGATDYGDDTLYRRRIHIVPEEVEKK
jgi:hypothetical protein